MARTEISSTLKTKIKLGRLRQPTIEKTETNLKDRRQLLFGKGETKPRSAAIDGVSVRKGWILFPGKARERLTPQA